MGKGPFKMKSSMAKLTTSSAKEKSVETTYGDKTITKSKGGKSSKYTLTSTKENYQGSGKTVQIYTNSEGNTETRVVG